jgi:hypothetical protein
LRLLKNRIKTKRAAVLPLVLGCLFLSACGGAPREAEAPPAPTSSAAVSMTLPAGTMPAASGQAAAYYEAFLWISAQDNAMRDVARVALDCSELPEATAEALTARARAFCEERGAALLLDDAEGLKQKGLLQGEGNNFPDGVLITIPRGRWEGGILTTQPRFWRGPLFAYGATEYVVRWDGVRWLGQSVGREWIS